MKIEPGMAALITGGASGIGRGITQVMADAGVKVVIADINIDGAKAVAAEMTDAGATVFATPLDVTKPSSWDEALADAESTAGPIQIFCNNAGVGGVLDTQLKDISDEAWIWTRSINFDGVFNGIRAVVPHMLAHEKGGHIVNTGSIASFLVSPNLGDYNSTKMAVLGLSETLRLELSEDNIGVSVLCPGGIRTSIAKTRVKRFNEGEAISEQLQWAVDFIDQGMDPVIVGHFVFHGIMDNSSYIFTHPEEHGAPVREQFDAVMAAIDWSAQVSKTISK